MEVKNTSRLKIAMVGYYNTLPFLYGLKRSKGFEIILDVPSKCMDYYTSDKAQIALVPVATLVGRNDYKIITDYCIGCSGAVRTVSLFSNNRITEINKIYLDQDSRTSQQLVRFLCERYWNIEPMFKEVDVRKIDVENINYDEAILMIGDKVFQREKYFKHNYDLGEEWQNFTGLSFPFAVWICKKDMSSNVTSDLNDTLKIGIENIDLVLQENKSLAAKIELSDYFKRYIDFHYDDEKEKALELFLEYCQADILKTN